MAVFPFLSERRSSPPDIASAQRLRYPYGDGGILAPSIIPKSHPVSGQQTFTLFNWRPHPTHYTRLPSVGDVGLACNYITHICSRSTLGLHVRRRDGTKLWFLLAEKE